MKWFNIMGIISIILFVIWIINQSMTDWTAGILDYKGFIPELWGGFLLVACVFMWLIWMGASIESEIDRRKINSSNYSKEKK